jgi:hypothetical protein
LLVGNFTLDPPSCHHYNTRFRRQQVMVNPDTQIILDEIARRFTEQEAKLDRRATDQDARWEALFSGHTAAQDARVRTLEHATGALEEWKMGIDGVVDDLRLEVGKIAKHCERALLDQPTLMTGILAHRHQWERVLLPDLQPPRPMGTASNRFTGRMVLGRSPPLSILR